MSRALLICGATGKQGGAVISHLVREKSDFEILAVTRDASSAPAQRLLKMSPRIKLVQGNLADPTRLFKTAKHLAKAPIWGVFSVQTPNGTNQGNGGELGQGKAMIDASIKAGVKFFLYTSVDRHGDDSPDNPTDVPHFVHKHKIEQHLAARTSDTDMEWAVLRPVAFMENLETGFPGRLFVTWWQMALGNRPLQLVATSDIGFFGARAFLHPEEFSGRGASLAGDEVTYEQMQAAFEKVVGRRAAGSYRIWAWIFMKMVKDVGHLFRWLHDVGHAADVQELRRRHPGLKSFETWLRTESEFKKHAK
ncbi:NmrA-like family protein [Colletotrichum plurivorum]|uniref:NmrA-like family protein n=1 Tax=Colletotrichum plurivorum TaxID=2175906 RepID=A0A8H6KPC2_9PEZI|nr:NmrA-like family protein [Colletotrichum plurivorum]